MNLPYDNVKDLVVKLKANNFQQFYVLPYNRFDVKKSIHWWLSPTPEKAAFRHAKVVFTTDASWFDSGDVFCGFNVEKGVKRDAASKASEVMDGTWFWHQFLDLAEKELALKVSQAAQSIDTNMQIFITAGPAGVGHEWDHLLFEVENGTLTQLEHNSPNRVLSEIAKSKDFAEFTRSLRKLTKDAEWFWVDLLIGSQFTLILDGPNHTQNFVDMMKPFNAWMLNEGSPQ